MYWEFVGSAAAILTMFGFVPQILKIHRTQSVADVSPFMLLQFLSGVFLWLLYGMHIGDKILIISNTVSFLSLMIAIGLYIRYKNNK